MRFEPTKQPLTLVGTGEPRVVFLMGGQWGPEHIINVFKGGTWTFSTDQTFLFQPSSTADLCNELYPVSGTYTFTNGVLDIQGMQQNGSHTASNILNGVLRIQDEVIQMEIIQTLTSTQKSVARISQMLYPRPTAQDSSTTIYATSFPLPSTYSIILTGRVDDDTFGPISGSLRLQPADRADINPLRVELTTERRGNIGSIYWASFLQRPHGQGLQCATITLPTQQQILLETTPEYNAVSPSWFTMKTTIDIGRPVQNVTGQQGQMTFSLEIGCLSGMIHLQGISDRKQESVYQAHITGEVVENRQRTHCGSTNAI